MSCGCRSNNRLPSCGCNECASSRCCEPQPCVPNCPKVCTSLIVTNAWNVPACDESAILYVPGLETVLIGSYISNPTYGTFKITGINSVGGKITVLNECLADNTPPGTVVPAGTEFIFGTPPTLTEWTSYTPVVTPGAGLVLVTSSTEGKYYTQGTTVFFEVLASFETTGTTAGQMDLSTPPGLIPASTTVLKPVYGANGDGTDFGRLGWRTLNTGTFIISGNTAWVDGTDGFFSFQGFYELD